MDKFSVIPLAIILYIYLCQVSTAIKIVDLKVPEALRSGSEQNVVLDCEFEVDESDKKDGGLTVKWFYGGDTQMIYQWLPGSPPQAVGLLRDRVDLEYKATMDANTMHRALKIKELSPVLTGSYTCKVSSFATEDIASKTMIIYKTAEELLMEHSEDGQTVNCTAYGLYPEPDMRLSIKDSNDTETFNITTIVEIDEETGFFNITKVFYYTEEQLLYPTEFICEVFIPGTEYKEAEKIMYFPGGEPTTTELPAQTIDYDYTTTTPLATENLAVTSIPSCAFTTTIALLCLLFTLK